MEARKRVSARSRKDETFVIAVEGGSGVVEVVDVLVLVVVVVVVAAAIVVDVFPSPPLLLLP